MTSARPLAPGYEIMWYTIHEVLGQGGFGITYLAHDRNLDRLVAIKEYLPTPFACRHQDYSVKPLTSDQRENFAWGLESFLKEAQTLAKFGHENIVQVHTVFEQNNTAYMVMQYEQGEDLASIYKRAGQSLDQQFFEKTYFPIFEGLKQIHSFGFIHRDIKPSNLYIRENGTPVLIDFGSARRTSIQQTGEMTALVTQGYTPLEQYSANYGEQGPWTDIYALAASMYQGVVGVKPDESLGRSASLMRDKPDPVQRLSATDYPGFEQRFLDAIFAGLALEPERRPRDLGLWSMQFTALAEPEPAISTTEEPYRGTDTVTRTAIPEGQAALPTDTHLPENTRTAVTVPSAATGGARHAPFAEPDFGVEHDGFGDGGYSDDLSRPAPSSSRKKRRKLAEKASGKKSSLVLPALASMVLLVSALVTGYYIVVNRGDSTVITQAMLATMPRPATAISVVLPKDESLRQLRDLLTLSNFYRQAHDLDSSNATVQQGIDGIYGRLNQFADNWHPSRHTDIADLLAQAAVTLPVDDSRRQSLLNKLAPAGRASALSDVQVLLRSGRIATPEGQSVLDVVNKLSVADLAALQSSEDYERMMATFRRTALAKLEQSDFDGVARLVEAALSVDPDDVQLLNVRRHLALK